MFFEEECRKYLEKLVNVCRMFELDINVITCEFGTVNDN